MRTDSGLWRHYSGEKFTLDRYFNYFNHLPLKLFKPYGLWVSEESSDDGWKSWCLREAFRTDRLNFEYEVQFVERANILHIKTPEALEDFNRKFLCYLPDTTIDFIDWRSVGDLFDGILIAPYQDAYRLIFDWYYPWDCASGCIWNLSAIASLKLVNQLQEMEI